MTKEPAKLPSMHKYRYSKFGNFREGFIFAKLCIIMRSFVKIKASQIGEITLSFTDVGKSRPCRDFSTWQICFNTIRENKISTWQICFNTIQENKIIAKIS